MGIQYATARSCAGKVINLSLIQFSGDIDTLPPGLTMRVTHVVTSHREGHVILASDNGHTCYQFTAPAMLSLPVIS